MMLKKAKPKIFHGLVNYGTQSGFFAKELRNRGYKAISLTNPDNFNRTTDIELYHGGSFIVKIFKHSFNIILRISMFFRYDIFHFYYGTTLLPYQLDLPLYKVLGKKVVMEYLGTDIQNHSISISKYKWTNCNFLMNDNDSIIHDKAITKRYNYEKNYIDKFLVCAPCYSEFCENSVVLPLALDLERFTKSALPDFYGDFIIMHAPTDKGNKGTDFIIDAIDRLIIEGYKIRLDLVENIEHGELILRYAQCHIFIDQILAGWYGTATIEAMAIGRPVIVSIRNSYFNNIDFGEIIPAINADPDSIYHVIKETISMGYDYLAKKGEESRKFVEEIHDCRKITSKLIEIYNEVYLK
jgi:glycosyltransferase involved in cell wall biosynthesis